MAIPTTKQLFDSIISQLESELNITIPIFGPVFLRALAAVQAAKIQLLWLSVASVQKNIFVDTADPEANGGTLERFGRVKLGREPFPATQGIYEVQVNGQVGANIPAGTTFKANDDSSAPGLLYIVDNPFTLNSNPDTLTIRALTAGLTARLQTGDRLTSTSPLLNITDEVVVTLETTTPLEAEDIESYRQATIDAFQLEPQGGAATDYRLWSQDAQGVRFVYPYAKSGVPAEIELYVEANQVDSADGKGTPTAQILTDVESVVEFDPDNTKPLNERGRRPLGVFNIDFLPVIPKDVEIEVVNSNNIDIVTQSQIFDALKAEIDNVRPFVESADILDNKNDVLNKNVLIAIIQDVLSGNQSFDTINLVVDSVLITTSITFTDGDIPFLLSVTYP
jgi:hypothetical protein